MSYINKCEILFKRRTDGGGLINYYLSRIGLRYFSPRYYFYWNRGNWNVYEEQINSNLVSYKSWVPLKIP